MKIKISKGVAFLTVAGLLIAVMYFMGSGRFDSLPSIERFAAVMVALVACFYLWRSSIS
jgi:ABC-type nickel/cobalt efflux system permease component RcnA